MFWRENRMLSANDIKRIATEKSWKETSIQVLLNNLMDKGYIEHQGYVKEGNHTSRIFGAIIPQNEYYITQYESVNGREGKLRDSAKRLVSSLISEYGISTEELDMIQKS